MFDGNTHSGLLKTTANRRSLTVPIVYTEQERQLNEIFIAVIKELETYHNKTDHSKKNIEIRTLLNSDFIKIKNWTYHTEERFITTGLLFIYKLIKKYTISQQAYIAKLKVDKYKPSKEDIQRLYWTYHLYQTLEAPYIPN